MSSRKWWQRSSMYGPMEPCRYSAVDGWTWQSIGVPMSRWSLRQGRTSAKVAASADLVAFCHYLGRHERGPAVAAFTSVDGTRLYYEEEGTGTPVVLLHGLSSSTKGNWQDP